MRQSGTANSSLALRPSARGREAQVVGIGGLVATAKDQLEAMLAAQMAAVHMATMTLGRRLGGVETVEQQDSAERAFNKIARTFTTQMEALKRYRTGGEQKVTVQHVSVSEGGQAIVGNVTQTAKTAPEKATKSLPALTSAQQTPMAIIGERNVRRLQSGAVERDDERPSA
jgi:hypothetical protein